MRLLLGPLLAGAALAAAAQGHAPLLGADGRSCAIVEARVLDRLSAPWQRLSSEPMALRAACQQLRTAAQCRLYTERSVDGCRLANVPLPERWLAVPADADDAAPVVAPDLPRDAAAAQAILQGAQRSWFRLLRSAGYLMTPGRGRMPDRCDWRGFDAHQLRIRSHAGAPASCGATIVGPAAMLTAAHCLSSLGGAVLRACPGGPQTVPVRCVALDPGCSTPGGTCDAKSDLAVCFDAGAAACAWTDAARVASRVVAPAPSEPLWLLGLNTEDEVCDGRQTRIAYRVPASASGGGLPASVTIACPGHAADPPSGLLSVDLRGPHLEGGDSGQALLQGAALAGVNVGRRGIVNDAVQLSCSAASAFLATEARSRGQTVCGVHEPVPSSCPP